MQLAGKSIIKLPLQRSELFTGLKSGDTKLAAASSRMQGVVIRGPGVKGDILTIHKDLNVSYDNRQYIVRKLA